MQYSPSLGAPFSGSHKSSVCIVTNNETTMKNCKSPTISIFMFCIWRKRYLHTIERDPSLANLLLVMDRTVVILTFEILSATAGCF